MRHKLKSGRSKGRCFPMTSKSATCADCGEATTKAQTQAIAGSEKVVSPARVHRPGVGCKIVVPPTKGLDTSS